MIRGKDSPAADLRGKVERLVEDVSEVVRVPREYPLVRNESHIQRLPDVVGALVGVLPAEDLVGRPTGKTEVVVADERVVGLHEVDDESFVRVARVGVRGGGGYVLREYGRFLVVEPVAPNLHQFVESVASERRNVGVRRYVHRVAERTTGELCLDPLGGHTRRARLGPVVAEPVEIRDGGEEVRPASIEDDQRIPVLVHHPHPRITVNPPVKGNDRALDESILPPKSVVVVFSQFGGGVPDRVKEGHGCWKGRPEWNINVDTSGGVRGSVTFEGTPPESLRGEGTLVSVVVPTYEDADRLSDALESVAAQTHGNVELIVVDSSDVRWIRDLAASVEGMEYLYQEPRGLSAARNAGIDAAQGEVVAFLDADDRWVPEKLEKQLAALEAGADVVYSDTYLVEPEGIRYQSALPVRDPERHHVAFLLEGGVPMPTVLARRNCFDGERFDESLPAVEDRHMWARLFAEYRPARVPEPLAYYTVREESMSSDAETMYDAERRVVADLVDRFPEVAAHRTELDRKATYKYGKRLLMAGDGQRARKPLRRAVGEGMTDPRALALLAIAYAPAGHARLLRSLERVQERIRHRYR